VNDEIEFGELEQAAPNRALRPDENRHYAVVAYGEPADRDLAIFVDLDVLAEMEEHAQSDTSVELGGVLLGGSYEDEQGRPFIVVTDSLRAQHYESTKGSFKFTHDTWSAITREREQFPVELSMVGWYHTHPDWGVFLSGMDMFICDNFFNKKLDVAYVIDPCRGDRGMFQWTLSSPQQDQRHRIRRTGGFFVTTSRFRAAELEYYVAELSSAMPGTTTRPAAGTYPAPVVHLHQPHDREPPWQALAVIGAVALQCVLLTLIAWKVLSTTGSSERPADEKMVAALEKLDASLSAVEARRRAELAEERAKARTELFDEAFRELKGADSGSISRLQSRFDQTARLSEDVASRDAMIREMRTALDDVKGKMQALETSAKREEKRLKAANDELEIENGRLQADLKKKKEELTSLTAKLNPKVGSKSASGKTGSETEAGEVSMWWWATGGLLVAILLVAGVWWIGGQRESPPPEAEEKTKWLEAGDQPPGIQ
jgi:proteasome lid subunit RPN8/RPN11